MQVAQDRFGVAVACFHAYIVEYGDGQAQEIPEQFLTASPEAGG